MSHATFFSPNAQVSWVVHFSEQTLEDLPFKVHMLDQ